MFLVGFLLEAMKLLEVAHLLLNSGKSEILVGDAFFGALELVVQHLVVGKKSLLHLLDVALCFCEA